MDEKRSLLPVSDDDEDAPRQKHQYRSISMVSSVAAATPVTLTWHRLSVSVRQRHSSDQRLVSVLTDVSGIACPGQLIAVMGASGCGKTTLLNALLDRNLNGLQVNGRVCINGESIGRDAITRLSAYVQQDDLFIGTLTVREHLGMQADLRLPRTMSADQRRRRVDEVIGELGLRKCQNTRIGNNTTGLQRGISGGEAKRLAFASEILTNPALLLCDEPTSGLDSFMAESVMRVLQRLARSGKTIVCTIHQPASELYTMFDRVLLLADGRTAFFGSPADSLKFFADCGHVCPDDWNPADLLIQTLAVVPTDETECRQRIDAICRKFDALTTTKEVIEEHRPNIDQIKRTSTVATASWFTQFRVLLYRSLLDNWRNASLARAKIIQKTIMGVFIGLLYLHTNFDQSGIANINGALFYMISEFTYPALFGIMSFMPADYPLVVREHHNGIYSVAAYYTSKSLAYMPLFTLDGVLMVMISYFLIGLRAEMFAFVFTLLIGICVEQSSSAFGVMLSAIAPSYAIAISIAGPILTLISLTGGLYANIGALPVYISWIQYTSWFRFGFEALAINQWSGVVNLTCTADSISCMNTGDDVLASLSFNAIYFYRDIALMIGWTIVFYLVGYIGMTIRVSRSR